MNTAPYELYRRLRQINPAPFANYFNFDGVSIVGASPERFLKVRGDRVETRPIKGTRPRGKTPEEDKALAESLLKSVKDRAENIMIVDLERNDIGRVCRYGTVKVTELAILETYPTVFHLTSTVVGQLREGKNLIDLLKATFPGGSITGAPKVRAMEIIDELEPTRRSVYTGSLGYLSFSGDMDLDIVIRTIIVKDGKAYFQVGGAIVYDSEPEAEYIETLDKGRALIQALDLSGGGKCGDNIMILVIDNYDSFTYNLVQYLGELGQEPVAYRNDAITLEEIERLAPSHIIISPGPCTPLEAGISNDVIRYFRGKIPILGVCLGHQCIGYVYGGLITRARLPMHGKESLVYHDGETIFQGLPSPLTAGRYHSLVIDAAAVPSTLEVSAKTEDGVIMGVRDRRNAVEGVQFHPESIMTPDGHQLLSNFLRFKL